MDLEKAIEEAIEVLKNREYDCKDAVTGAWDVFLCEYFANNSTIVTQSTPSRLTCKCVCTDENCAFMSAQSTSKGKWSIKKIRRRKHGKKSKFKNTKQGMPNENIHICSKYAYL